MPLDAHIDPFPVRLSAMSGKPEIPAAVHTPSAFVPVHHSSGTPILLEECDDPPTPIRSGAIALITASKGVYLLQKLRRKWFDLLTAIGIADQGKNQHTPHDRN